MDINVQGTYDAIFSILKSEFKKGIDEASPVFNAVYENVGSSAQYNIYGWLGHVPGMKEWFQGDSRIYRNVETHDFAVQNRLFEATIPIPVVKVEDDQLGQYAQLSKSLGKAGATLPDQLIGELFNNGFTTALAYDGLPWFSDSHTVGLSTIDNKGTAPLSTTSYATAYQALRGYKVQPDKDSAARPLNPGGKYLLVVPPQLEFTARQICEAEYLTTDKISNIYKGTAEVLVSSWLTSATAWFLLNVGAGIKPIFMQERTKLQLLEKTPMSSDRAFERDELIFGSKWRGAVLPTQPWLAYGSTGDAT